MITAFGIAVEGLEKYFFLKVFDFFNTNA